VSNCGPVELTISGFELEGSTSFSVLTPDPVYVAAGAEETIELAWVPADQQPDSLTLGLLSNAPDKLEIAVVGNDCEASVLDSWDDDGDGWFSCGGDCDDDDAAVHPGALELANGVDDDCDGAVDEAPNPTSSDDDGDGWSEDDGDCDDADEAVHPDATETIDGVDQDCDGAVDNHTERFDDDGDGFSERAGDCDDSDPAVHPGAEESEDDRDDDCDGLVDEGGPSFDDDGDGFAEADGDCDDEDPWSFPGAAEDCDEVDNDCDSETDEGEACAYLVERVMDTGLGQPGGCSSTGRGPGGLGLALLALLGLLGICRRDLPWPM
jgi:MYXO-CTERM domain-containing protein